MGQDQERLQKLFEKISDAYADGLVEQKHITEGYVDVQFLRSSSEGSVEVGHVRLSFVDHVVIGNHDENLSLVKVVDHYGGEEVLVSDVTSAVIAVATR
jgi:hypothetical protein